MKIKRIIRFLTKSKQKKVVLKTCFYSIYYRLHIVLGKRKNLQKLMGIKGEESPNEIDEESLRLAKRIASCVNRINYHMPWDKKCLTRALTLQKLLKDKNIQSTVYLGVRKLDGVMVAHAWLRCGSAYLTGGFGEDYVVVERFRT